MQWIGVRVTEDVAAIVEAAVACDPEMTRSRVVREALREYAETHGIEVPACPA